MSFDTTETKTLAYMIGLAALIMTLAVLVALSGRAEAGWVISANGQRIGELALRPGDRLTANLIQDDEPGGYMAWIEYEGWCYYYPTWDTEEQSFYAADEMTNLIDAYLSNQPSFQCSLNAMNMVGETRSVSIEFEHTDMPTPIPYLTPTPQPQPYGWLGGEIVFQVEGTGLPLYDAYECGVVISLTNENCGVLTLRLTNFFNDCWRYQLWGSIDGSGDRYECFFEYPVWDAQPSADGEWRLTWEPIEGCTVATAYAPNGTSEMLTIPYLIAYRDLHTGPTNCDRPRVWPVTTTTILSQRWDLFGAGTECEE